MADFSRESEIVITCPKNISPVLAEEIKSLGYVVLSTETALVRIKGNLMDCMRLNMWLRTAHKVLYKLWDIKAHGPEDLYKEIFKFPWETFISSTGFFTVTSQVVNEKIKDTRFANLTVKDAIADRIKSKKGERPDSGPEKDRVVVFLHWHEDKAAFFIDTSGETIAKHGYRKLPGKAPMQETLAAAVILSSRWKPGVKFYNPMCGSGTLAIEAAMIATNKAPGLYRDNYGFMHLLDFPFDQWLKIKDDATRSLIKLKGDFYLSDHDSEAIEGARKNAEAAGFAKDFNFQVLDFRDINIDEAAGGIVIFNPEYGERLGEEGELENIYKEIGDFFKKRCNGYTGYVFTGNLDLAKKVGLKTKRKIPFYNGTIECRLLEYELYQGSRKIF